MTDSLATILKKKHTWPFEFCPTVNGWPSEKVAADDPEADRLAQVLEYYWQMNNTLCDLGRASQAEERENQARKLDDILREKPNLDAELTRWAAFAEPVLAAGMVSDVLYTCPRGNWNPALCIYQRIDLEV